MKIPMLKELPNHRNQSYITYPAAVLLMTRILSSIFYISSMRKTSEEFNSDTVVENIWSLCGEEPAKELPYWETINRYLKGLDSGTLQEIVCQLCRRLLRSRAFEGSRIRGKYWQVIIDGTQPHSSRGELDEKSLYRIHNRGTKEEYRESYYYVLEAGGKLWEKTGQSREQKHWRILESFKSVRIKEVIGEEDGEEEWKMQVRFT